MRGAQEGMTVDPACKGRIDEAENFARQKGGHPLICLSIDEKPEKISDGNGEIKEKIADERGL